MSDDSKHQTRSNELGELVAYIRNDRGLSRARLVALVHKYDDTVSEGLIRTIEEGTRANVSRQLLELLAEAMECTPAERLALIIAADRNPHAGPDGKTSESTLLMLRLFEELMQDKDGQKLLNILVEGNKTKVRKLTRIELFKILETIVMFLKSKIKN